MVLGFLKGMTYFVGYSDFCEVSCFRLFWLFLCYVWALYGFRDLQGLRSSSMMHGFLECWWFRGFLRGLLILGETEVLVLFSAFGCFGYLWVRDKWFTDFVILRDSIVLP